MSKAAKRRAAAAAKRAELPPPSYRVAAYTVYPTGYDRIAHPDRARWCLTVADAGDGWAIRRANVCLNFSNQWEHEPPPSSRDAAFRRRCRYNEHAALMRARQVIDQLTVGGEAFDEFVDRVNEEVAEQVREYLRDRGSGSALGDYGRSPELLWLASNWIPVPAMSSRPLAGAGRGSGSGAG